MPRLVEPEFAVISAPEIYHSGLQKFLKAHNCEDWSLTLEGVEFDAESLVGCIPGAELLPVIAGKICYMSFKPGLNPNVDRVRESLEDIHESYKSHAHTRLYTHPHFSLLLWNVSRDTTHQLLTHDTGTTRSEKSFRYCSVEALDYFMPPGLPVEARESIADAMWDAEVNLQRMAKSLDIQAEKSFFRKKQLTDAVRKTVPGGVSTVFMLTANATALRHMIQMRTSRHASPEIRCLFGKIAEELKEGWPLLFGDLQGERVGHYLEYTSHHASNPYDQAKLTAAYSEIESLKRQLLESEKSSDDR